MEDYSCNLIDFNDGHSPGSTQVETKLASYRNKNSENFFTIFDNLLSEEWCTKAYMYSLKRKKPWGKALVCPII